MRQLKIDMLSVLVVTDKLEFVGLKARKIPIYRALYPERTRIHMPVFSCNLRSRISKG